MTKAIAVSGSLRTEKSKTSQILTPFIEGMKEAGATAELFYVKRLNIKPCTGEFYCWNKNPGQCHIQDDMQMLYPKLREADILVLATPVYIPLPGEMQNFVNRTVPLLSPVLKWQDSRTRAKFHDDVKIRKMALVASSGWWELGNFGTVVRIAKELAKDASVDFAGALLRPHAWAMSENKENAGEVLEASKRAGYQLVREGRISRQLLKRVSQPLVSEREYWEKHANE